MKHTNFFVQLFIFFKNTQVALSNVSISQYLAFCSQLALETEQQIIVFNKGILG